MALTTEQIIKTAHEAGLYQDGINTQLLLWVLTQQELERFADSIEAEVRKKDDVLIQQMLDALESLDGVGTVIEWYGQWEKCISVVTAAKNRLNNSQL